MVSLQMVRERLKEQVSHVREAIAPFAKPLTITALIFFIAITSYWYWHIPSMGKAIGVLGVAAAVMALRGETHGSEKVIWMFIIFGLLYVEVQAINKDAADRQSERVAANKEFGRITDGLKEVITQNQVAMDRNQQQFEKTMDSFGENAKMTTGGDSFCYLDISPLMPEKNAVNHAAWMGVTRVGKYPLHGISMVLTDAVRYSEVASHFHGTLPQGHIPTSDEVMTMMRQASEASTMRQSIPDFATPNRSISGVFIIYLARITRAFPYLFLLLTVYGLNY